MNWFGFGDGLFLKLEVFKWQTLAKLMMLVTFLKTLSMFMHVTPHVMPLWKVRAMVGNYKSQK